MFPRTYKIVDMFPHTTIEYYAVSDPPNMHVRATRYAI